jgi:hypothetical protein
MAYRTAKNTKDLVEKLKAVLRVAHEKATAADLSAIVIRMSTHMTLERFIRRFILPTPSANGLPGSRMQCGAAPSTAKVPLRADTPGQPLLGKIWRPPMKLS